MKKLVNHPAFQLQDDAADSLARYERDHGVIPITSAYRSQAEQDVLKKRWAQGGPANRPPYLYEPANVSTHTSGLAIDTPSVPTIRNTISGYGWLFLFDYDKVHLEYRIASDQHRGATAPAKGKRPTIKQGATGQNVKDLQTILNKYHGSKLKVDSVYGPATVKAVKAFQKKAKIAQDGIVGPSTWSKLGQ